MNYYEILEIKRDASQAEIRKRYKALIKKYHPDLYDGDKKFAEEKTMQINMAYDVLSVPELKEEYDIELELEEQKNIRDTEPINNYNDSDPNITNDEDDYMNDPVFRNMYERYNLYRNNHIFHKNYAKTQDNNHEKRSYADRFDDEVGRHVKNAENYVERKITVLELKQKLLLSIIAILIVIIFIIVSLYRIKSLTRGQIDRINTREYDAKDYNVKSEEKSDYETFVERFLNGLNSAYSNSVEDWATNSVTENNEIEPDVPLNELNNNKVNNAIDNIKEKYKNFKFNIGDYEINTDTLDGISNDVKGAINFYYNAIKDIISETELNKYSEEEIKAIIYDYLQNNQFNWYKEEDER